MYETHDGHDCPSCGGLVAYRLDCPRWKGVDGRMMSCMGCGNAVAFACRKPDADGDLLEEGCGWWFQYPLHPEASNYSLMSDPPGWDYKAYL